MPIWREDKELSKYSRYKVKMDLTKIGTSSERACIARSLAGVLLRGAALARVRSHVSVLAFACVFGWHKLRVVTVVTHCMGVAPPCCDTGINDKP